MIERHFVKIFMRFAKVLEQHVSLHTIKFPYKNQLSYVEVEILPLDNYKYEFKYSLLCGLGGGVVAHSSNYTDKSRLGQRYGHGKTYVF
jgi:hypothetical protein